MSEKIKKEDGTEVEVFTVEELDRARSEAVEKFKKENPGQASEVEKLQKDLEKANKDLIEAQAKLGQDDTSEKAYSFKATRDIIKRLEEKNAELEKTIDSKISGVTSALVSETLSEMIVNLAGADEELKKKIRFNYDRIKDPGTTKEEVKKKVMDAYLLATAKVAPDPFRAIISSAGAGNLRNPPTETKEIKPEVKEIGKKMGLKEDDFKKAGYK